QDNIPPTTRRTHYKDSPFSSHVMILAGTCQGQHGIQASGGRCFRSVHVRLSSLDSSLSKREKITGPRLAKVIRSQWPGPHFRDRSCVLNLSSPILVQSES